MLLPLQVQTLSRSSLLELVLELGLRAPPLASPDAEQVIAGPHIAGLLPSPLPTLLDRERRPTVEERPQPTLLRSCEACEAVERAQIPRAMKLVAVVSALSQCDNATLTLLLASALSQCDELPQLFGRERRRAAQLLLDRDDAGHAKSSARAPTREQRSRPSI